MARKRSSAVAGPYDGEPWLDPEKILERLEQADPNSVNSAMGCCVQRAVGEVVETDAAADKATFTIVTRDKTRNRHGNMVQIVESEYGRGMLLDAYAPNPVVLFEHGYGGIALPVGLSETPDRRLTVKLSKNKATADVYFSKLPHGQMIGAAVHEGLIRMASVGYRPLKAMKLKPPKEGELPDGVEDLERYRAQYGMDFVESELMEWSVTLIGADRGALRQTLDRGKIHDVRLSPLMRQSIEMAVGDRPAWSPGWRPPEPPVQQAAPILDDEDDDDEDDDIDRPETVRQEFEGVMLVGSREAVDRFVAQRSPVQIAVDAPPEIATTSTVPEPVIRIDDLARVFEQRQQQQASPAAIEVQALSHWLSERVAVAIDARLAPVAQSVEKLEKELHRMTGRIDP